MRLYFEMVYVDGLNESGGAGLGIADRLPLFIRRFDLCFKQGEDQVYSRNFCTINAKIFKLSYGFL